MDEFIKWLENYMQLVQSSIDELTEEEAEIVNQFISEALAFVQKSLQGQGEAQTLQTPTAPQVEPAQFPSSNINAYTFDPQTGKMLVQFHGKYPNAAGPVYLYDNVSPNEYSIINKGQIAPRTSGKNGFHEWKKNISPSHGASVYALLKEGGKSYRKVA